MLMPSVRTGINTQRRMRILATTRRRTRTVVRRGFLPKRISRKVSFQPPASTSHHSASRRCERTEVLSWKLETGRWPLCSRRIRRQQAGRGGGDDDVDRVQRPVATDVDGKAVVVAG